MTTPLRPIGHIAGRLDMLAVIIAARMRRALDDRRYLLWVDDDGCVYLAPVDHQRANAVLRYAPEQRIATFRKPVGKPFPRTARDLHAEMDQARADFAARALAQSRECAA